MLVVSPVHELIDVKEHSSQFNRYLDKTKNIYVLK